MSETTIIRVGQTAKPMSSFADYLDGERAIVRRVGLTIQEETSGPILVLLLPEGGQVRWHLSDIRTVPDQADQQAMVLAEKNNPVARLLVTDREAQKVLAARAQNLLSRPPTKGKSRLAAWSIAAVASVVLIVFVLVPVMADQLANYLPAAGEKALGDKTFEQVRLALSESEFAPLEICTNASGLAAMNKMRQRVEDQTELPYPLTVHVLDHEMVNAFALPGGHVVFFRGLIDEAEHPDEVAAVLAHEVGHVVNRDPARGALRSAGSIGVLGLIFGDFAGGAAVLFMVERLIDATYTREAEAQADVFAHSALAGSGISPSSLGTLFERLLAKHGESEGIVAHFMSHPSLGDRIAAARDAEDLLTGPVRPSLAEQDWQNLRNICR